MSMSGAAAATPEGSWPGTGTTNSARVRVTSARPPPGMNAATFAGQFGIAAEEGGANLSLDHLIDRLRATITPNSHEPAMRRTTAQAFDRRAGELRA